LKDSLNIELDIKEYSQLNAIDVYDKWIRVYYKMDSEITKLSSTIKELKKLQDKLRKEYKYKYISVESSISSISSPYIRIHR